jgi:hypothetical protein
MRNFSRFLLSTLALAFVLSLTSTAHATTWVVGSCSGDPYLTGPDGLQNVLGDNGPSPLAPGDTIELCSSPIFAGDNVVYTDNITITNVPKQAKPFINCQEYTEELEGGNVGIAVLANGVTVKNVVVEGCLVGIFDGGVAFQVGDLSDNIPATLNSLKAPYNATHQAPVGPLVANIDPAWKTHGKHGGKRHTGCPTTDVNLCISGDDIEGNLLGVLTIGMGDMDMDSNLFSANGFGAIVVLNSFTSKIANNNITGFNDVATDEFLGSAGILDVDSDQDTIENNKVQNTGIAIDLEGLIVGTQQTTVKGNTVKYNAAGLGVDVIDYFFNYNGGSSQNVFSSNTAKNNYPPNSALPFLTGGCLDFTVGGGTAGTADTWKSSNKCDSSEDITGAPLP